MDEGRYRFVAFAGFLILGFLALWTAFLATVLTGCVAGVLA